MLPRRFSHAAGNEWELVERAPHVIHGNGPVRLRDINSQNVGFAYKKISLTECVFGLSAGGGREDRRKPH
jgi:hypothetical protein